MRRIILVLALAIMFTANAALAANEEVKSGPQPGSNLPGPFYSLVAHAAEPDLPGKKMDFTEMYGQNPVLLVFARELTMPLAKLVSQLDAEAAKQTVARLKVLIVILSDDAEGILTDVRKIIPIR